MKRWTRMVMVMIMFTMLYMIAVPVSHAEPYKSINGTDVNFRDAPSYSSGIIGTINWDCALAILDYEGDFIHVRITGVGVGVGTKASNITPEFMEGKVGWVHKDYVVTKQF